MRPNKALGDTIVMSPRVLSAVVWLALALGFAFLGEWKPTSKDGWVMLIIFGPPLYVIVAALYDRPYSTQLVRNLERHPSTFIRIGGLTLFFLATSAVFLFALIGAVWLYHHH